MFRSIAACRCMTFGYDGQALSFASARGRAAGVADTASRLWKKEPPSLCRQNGLL